MQKPAHQLENRRALIDGKRLPLDADGSNNKKKSEKDKKNKKDGGRARWAVQVFCISVTTVPVGKGRSAPIVSLPSAGLPENTAQRIAQRG